LNFKDLKKNWDKFGKTDPYWAILTDPDKKNNQWDVNDFFETGEREVAILMNKINSLDVKIPLRKALDFGCGAGRLTQALAIYFYEVHGVDVAPSMIELARRHNRRGGKCIYYINEQSSLALFPNNTFDFIFSIITLQHMHPYYSRKYIREFIRVLTPNGLLIFQIPSFPKHLPNTPINKFKLKIINMLPSKIWNLYLKYRYRYDPQRMEMYGIEKHDVVKILKKADAKIIDIAPDNAATDWIGFRYIVTKEKY